MITSGIIVSPGSLCSQVMAAKFSGFASILIELFGRWEWSPSHSGLGGLLNSMVISVTVSASALPARRKNGTPLQRGESISSRNAANVSVSEFGATPATSR
ncbi:unannotated protein [freshwater metagenome]|uniref:Unannotated protein n=1 Tax=freshwater metagenome TaxID=449393 RepID=A0A6J5YFF0_9ZZZZ